MAQRHAMRPDSWTIVWLISAVLGSLALFAVFRSARTSNKARLPSTAEVNHTIVQESGRIA